ncbi:DNA polymerase epsilon subunit 2-like [Amphibalanus amphitrite]|uniref:DNA polymerase epsilon subunit 2-like n=1 Tax=Amphibalanus amphitrite TaxID=1232801 RepID=UPI001C91C9C8|nr:DNA polymerase epsilon subunit 2-like [Amphibalanus amphitrite]XP_043201112.1 DNA polymerase epsilon subunit 2-like [Amphibalanus amphitrite]XP_043201114.1 DNA polymerase epsilon subunit 2-like [Amphibalanus amphitrite]
MERSALKHSVNSTFRLNGYTLKNDAANYIVEALLQVGEQQRQLWMDKILATVQKQPLDTAIIGRDLVRDVLQNCIRETRGEVDFFMVFDAFSVPGFSYCVNKQKFLKDELLGLPAGSVLPDSVAPKAEVFRNRYHLIQQRCLRNELFGGTDASGGGGRRRFRLQPVELLLGSTSRLEDVLVLGMLTQLTEGKFFLEDPTGAVQLDLEHTKFPVGMFSEGCFVLCEGSYDDNIFTCSVMGFPPAEDAETFRNHFGNQNMFGGSNHICARANTELQSVEKELDGSMFVFLSDVLLNQPQVMDRLRRLLDGFKHSPPTAFVMMGNFTDAPRDANSYRELRKHFTTLAEMITKVPELRESRFVFVPGPTDPGIAPILPRPPLSAYISEEFRRRVPNSEFTTNPCRIQFCTQEMVIFREDVLSKLCRHGIYYPTENCPDIPPHFVTTLVSQCHLAPLPPHICPVYWQHDRALRLYPLPDVVVCADKFDQYTITKLGCTVLNPGSFHKDFMFKVYLPSTRTCENSQVGDDS